MITSSTNSIIYPYLYIVLSGYSCKVFILMVRVRMDGQRRIRIPRKAGVEGDTFLLLALGSYHILFPGPSEKPELDIEGPIAKLLTQAEVEIIRDVTERWRRKDQDAD